MRQKIFISILAIIAACIIMFFYVAHLVFTSFEHKDDHNGVGWRQFSQGLKRHIKDTDFHATDFGHYEGKVWFGALKSKNRSIKLGMFTRASFEDPRNLQTLKHATIYEIGGTSISCIDMLGHTQNTSISIWNMDLKSDQLLVSSIAGILENYQFIENIVKNYKGGTYSVIDNTANGLPSWIDVNINHAGCKEKDHIVEQMTCDVSGNIKAK